MMDIILWDTVDTQILQFKIKVGFLVPEVEIDFFIQIINYINNTLLKSNYLITMVNLYQLSTLLLTVILVTSSNLP